MRVRIRTFLPGRAQPSPPEAGEVHLWLAALDQPPEAREWLGGLLSAEERERAGRYRVARVRDQFVAGRGLLRLLLAGCLGADPREIPIVYEPNGKPVLGPGESLQFNLSHSEGRALIAIGRGGRVGVDLERVRPLANIDVLVERFFSPRERAAYRRLPEALREAAFFHGWTRKEAILKARGMSVQCLDQFDVSLRPDEPARLLAWEGEPEAPARWSLWSGELGENFVGALAVEAPAGAPRVEWE